MVRMLHEDHGYLATFKAYHDIADGLFNRMRSGLSAQDPSMSFQLRSSLQGAVGGHQGVLNRAFSCLTVEYHRLSKRKASADLVASVL